MSRGYHRWTAEDDALLRELYGTTEAAAVALRILGSRHAAKAVYKRAAFLGLRKWPPEYAQMLGRATRPLKGVVDGPTDAASRKLAIANSPKPWATVLDFVGNVDRHGEQATVSAADILGGNATDAVIDYAKRAMAQSKTARPVDAAIERAEAEMALLAEESERKARIVAEVDYRVRYLDTAAGPQREFEHGKRGEPATDKQIWKLCRLGISRIRAEGMTKKQASAVIGKLMALRGEE